jgi:hypothetical protein
MCTRQSHDRDHSGGATLIELAETGTSLWQFQTGGRVHANPVSFTFDGRQHIVIASGNAILVFGLPSE